MQSTSETLDNCWGFADGTVRPTGRPERNQRVVHALKSHSAAAPNRLIANLYAMSRLSA